MRTRRARASLFPSITSTRRRSSCPRDWRTCRRTARGPGRASWATILVAKRKPAQPEKQDEEFAAVIDVAVRDAETFDDQEILKRIKAIINENREELLGAPRAPADVRLRTQRRHVSGVLHLPRAVVRRGPGHYPPHRARAGLPARAGAPVQVRHQARLHAEPQHPHLRGGRQGRRDGPAATSRAPSCARGA